MQRNARNKSLRYRALAAIETELPNQPIRDEVSIVGTKDLRASRNKLRTKGLIEELLPTLAEQGYVEQLPKEHICIGLGEQHRYYRTTGVVREDAYGVWVREQRTKDGTLGYVYFNPIDGQNYLWAIGHRTRRPFKLARVN